MHSYSSLFPKEYAQLCRPGSSPYCWESAHKETVIIPRKSRLEPSIRTQLLPSPRLVWWLPGTRQFTDACPALVGMRDSGSSCLRPGRLLGDSNPSAFEPSPSFSHQLCENRSPLSFLATDGPWSPAPRLPTHQPQPVSFGSLHGVDRTRRAHAHRAPSRPGQPSSAAPPDLGLTSSHGLYAAAPPCRLGARDGEEPSCSLS